MKNFTAYTDTFRSFYHGVPQDYFSYYIYRILLWHLRDRSPILGVIKITQRCNLRCIHCPWVENTQDPLCTDDWKRIIQRLWQQGCNTIIFEGGEPTLRSDLWKLVYFARSLGLYTIVATNGTRGLDHCSPHAFLISAEGPPHIHDHIRGKGSFARTFQTIRTNSHRQIITLTTLSPSNAMYLEEIATLLHPHVSALWFNFVYPYNETIESLSQEQRISLGQQIIQLKKRFPNILNSNSFLRSTGSRWKCRSWLMASVDHCGRYLHGCMIDHQGPHDCSQCDLSCYGDLSMLYEIRWDAALNWTRYLGKNLLPVAPLWHYFLGITKNNAR